MGSVNPNPWSPNETYKDCSQGICSVYCQQWCDIVFPPPPPFGLEDGDHSAFQFSPLIVAVIGILASAFVLVCYYTIISKYCRRRGNHDPATDLIEHRDLLDNEPAQASSRGLGEALIKSIAVCKYKKDEGLVEGTDCSVCLSEFQENESLRLLPECLHAFHLPCIDTWLKANSSCPLCRSNIASTNSVHPQAVPPQQNPPAPRRSAPQSQNGNDTTLEIQELEASAREEAVVSIESNVCPKNSIQSAGQRDTSEGRDHVIEIRQEGVEAFRRPLSINYSECQRHVSIAEISRTSKINGEYQSEISEIGSSKGLDETLCTANEKRGVLVSDRSIPGMKRSISTGGFKFARYGKGDNSVNPN